jgi:hypothetical protein
MTRFDLLNARYGAAASIVSNGIEMITVGDSVGAHLDAAIKQLIGFARIDGPELWGDVLGASRQLRWRLVTEPQPIRLNPQLQDVARTVRDTVKGLNFVVGDDAKIVLVQLRTAAEDVEHHDPVLGPVLIRCIEEVGAESCVVLAAGARAASGLLRWFSELGMQVPIEAGIDRRSASVIEQTYAVGPPRVFLPSVVTSPTTTAITFLMPSWETNRSIPLSALAGQAAGAIRPRVRVFTEGIEPLLASASVDVIDDLMPLPIWVTQAATREPGIDEVLANRVMLSGGLSIYLDGDGEHIRSLDPTQPSGERVTHSPVSLVGVGTYLVLREGETERQALYDRAIKLLGERGERAEESQRRWKDALQEKLRRLGRRSVGQALADVGVKRTERATAWTEQTLARPQSDEDFARLLKWLDIPANPTIELATQLRRLRLQASADVRESLERALSEASMSDLEAEGHLRLDLHLPGFRGIIATRVLAISPHADLISRHDVRITRPDSSAQWLE